MATHTRPDGSFQFDELAAGVSYIDVTRAGYLDDRGLPRRPSCVQPDQACPLRIVQDVDVAVQLIRTTSSGDRSPTNPEDLFQAFRFVPVGHSSAMGTGRSWRSATLIKEGGKPTTRDASKSETCSLAGTTCGQYHRNEVQAEAIVGETPMQYVTTFAPGTREPEAAAVIEVSRGERSLGVNITLARATVDPSSTSRPLLRAPPLRARPSCSRPTGSASTPPVPGRGRKMGKKRTPRAASS